jgi:hypothetical protein
VPYLFSGTYVAAGSSVSRRITPQCKSTAINCEWLRIAVQMDQLVDFGSVLAMFTQTTVVERDGRRDLPVQMGNKVWVLISASLRRRLHSG